MLATHIGPLYKTCQVDDGPLLGYLAGVLRHVRSGELIFVNFGPWVFIFSTTIVYGV